MEGTSPITVAINHGMANKASRAMASHMATSHLMASLMEASNNLMETSSSLTTISSRALTSSNSHTAISNNHMANNSPIISNRPMASSSPATVSNSPLPGHNWPVNLLDNRLLPSSNLSKSVLSKSKKELMVGAVPPGRTKGTLSAMS